MGSGVSTEGGAGGGGSQAATNAGVGMGVSARPLTEEELLATPVDASDIQDLETARIEIRRLREHAKSSFMGTRDSARALSGVNTGADNMAQSGGTMNGSTSGAPANGSAIATTTAGGTQYQRLGRAAVIDHQKFDPTSYEKRVVPKPDEIKAMLSEVVQQSILFKNCSQEEREDLVDAFEPRSAVAGEAIITQGERGDNFYIVESGELDIFLLQPGADQEIQLGSTLTSRASFGELALMYDTPRAATVRCSPDKNDTPNQVKLWFIDRQTVRAITLHHKFQRTSAHLEFVRNMEVDGLKLGDQLSADQLHKLSMALEPEEFAAGTFVLREGEVGDYFYIIERGEVAVHKQNSDEAEPEFPGPQVATLQRGAFFGELALLHEDVRAASCKAATDLLCLTLARDEFHELFGSWQDIVRASAAGGGTGGEGLAAAESKKGEDEMRDAEQTGASASTASGSQQQDQDDNQQQKQPQESEIALEQLQSLVALGQGAFGDVKLVRFIPNATAGSPMKPQFFACKAQAKQVIIDNSLQEHVVNEATILRSVRNDFIVRLTSVIQDPRYLYLVMEYLPGGDLFSRMHAVHRFSEADAKFYVACVVQAFIALHDERIAYRDLKPENLVLDAAGYCKVVDFGLAKHIPAGKTWTFCGTPDYLAPEIILSEGHDHAVDLWALGVLLYECVAGVAPFAADDPMEVYERILGANFSIPSPFSRSAGDLVKKLLRTNPSKRLGQGKGGTRAILKHKWFSGFDWAGLNKGILDAPFVPATANPSEIFPEPGPIAPVDDSAPETEWFPDFG